MTLKDIAAAAGTSVSTVSRVLNQSSPSCASKELQEKIWQIAMEGGYLPNENARSLRKDPAERGNAVKVAVVLARTRSLKEAPFFAELFRCLESELLKQRMIMQRVYYEDTAMQAQVADCDGVVILGRCSRELLGIIKRQNRNVVGIWRNPHDFNVDEVICDGRKAAETAVGHLILLGHKKIAYIGACSNEQRHIGYLDMLMRNGIPIDYSIIKETDQTAGQARKAFDELMELEPDRFSAIFCANDVTAIRVLELIQENKKKLKGRKISVISIDDIEQAQDTQPYLTTVRIPRREMAHMGVLLLEDRINGGHEETIRNEFPCRLVVRSSCYEQKS